MLFSISWLIAFLAIIFLVPSFNFDLNKFTDPQYVKEAFPTTSSLGLDKFSNIDNFNFGAAGDWGCTPDTVKTIENIQDKSPEFILALGDLSYEEAPQCWFDIINPIENKTLIAIGNHDNETPEKLKTYMDYFGLEQQYYSFNYENIHFIAISTEVPFDEESSQYSFVSNDLVDASMDWDIDWIVVFYHTLAYTSPADIGKGNSADKELRDTYHPLFDKYNVDLVLQAHNHNYQRSYPIIYNIEDPKNPVITDNSKNNYVNPKGIVFSTIGTGGAEAYPLTGQAQYIVAQYVGFGYLNVDVTNNGETISGIYYANDGSIKDQFTISKKTQQ